MKTADAISLIEKGITDNQPQRWADLGCGNGTFTYALAALLPNGSHIDAIDAQQQHLDPPINFIRANFESDDLSLKALDGVLMANSLHYVKDKQRLIPKLETYFAGRPTFLIVEYDTGNTNQWVPYPIPFQTLSTFFSKLGYSSITKLAERPSIYNSAKMYAAIIHKK